MREIHDRQVPPFILGPRTSRSWWGARSAMRPDRLVELRTVTAQPDEKVSKDEVHGQR
jgi:hypothetical protein